MNMNYEDISLSQR